MSSKQLDPTQIILFIAVFGLMSCNKNSAPTVTTVSVRNLSDTSLVCGGTVVDDGGSIIIERGVCYDAGENPDLTVSHTHDGSGMGSFSSYITGLVSNTTYWLRAYATNEVGIAYGNPIQINTFFKPVSLGAGDIGINSARLFGMACSHSTLDTEYYIDLGTSENSYDRSLQASIVPMAPIPPFGPYKYPVPVFEPYKIISLIVENLKESTVYHYRIRATSSESSTLGNDLSFKTFDAATVKDIDGNSYNSISIGSQTWMAQNLKTTRLTDGSPIPGINDSTEWRNLRVPGYCWYNNNEASYDMCGALYNWYAANSGKLCPIGWHVPTASDWETLVTNIGGTDEAEKLKTVYYGGTNLSGFSAITAGIRDSLYNFDRGLLPDGFIPSGGSTGVFWSSGVEVFEGLTFGLSTGFYVDSPFIYKWVQNRSMGCSVRCIKD